MSTSRSARSNAGGHEQSDHSARLRAELDHAREHFAALDAEYNELLGDPGVIQEDRDAAAMLLEHARRQFLSAKSAVEQLDAGGYGRCAKCGGEIGPERLAALPGVTTCVRCAR